MHPLRALSEWYNIVQLSPLIKNKNVYSRCCWYLRHFGWFFIWPLKKKVKMPIWCNSSLLSSAMLTFMSRPSILKILNSISQILKAKRKILTYYMQDGCQFELQFCIFSLLLNEVPLFLTIQFMVTCLSHKGFNFGKYFQPSLSDLLISFITN